jgi:mycoredoxin
MNHKITVYGTTWCRDCARAKRILDALSVDYDWIDITHNVEATQFVQKVANGYKSVPTIVFPDGSCLIEPSDDELIECIQQKVLSKNSTN